MVNFPVLPDNHYKIDVARTCELIDQYRPELIIFGKSMVLHKEPVAEIRRFLDEQGLDAVVMYDMAHVLGLVGPHFQQPFAEGADIVTGSTHKTFFGTQRGVVATRFGEHEERYDLWESVRRRTFPGSVSNHHLGTMLGLLLAAYEMNHFRDAYQTAVIANAKAFARALADAGLDVAGDPTIDFTETHQVIVEVGYGRGPEIARRLEANNIICNYQAAPDEEGFTAAGALRLGVAEMTRFGMQAADFRELAGLHGGGHPARWRCQRARHRTAEPLPGTPVLFQRDGLPTGGGGLAARPPAARARPLSLLLDCLSGPAVDSGSNQGGTRGRQEAGQREEEAQGAEEVARLRD